MQSKFILADVNQRLKLKHCARVCHIPPNSSVNEQLYMFNESRCRRHIVQTGTYAYAPGLRTPPRITTHGRLVGQLDHHSVGSEPLDNRTHAFFRLQRTVSIQSVPQPQNTHAAGKVAGTCHGCVRPLSDSDSNRSAARTPNLSYDFRRELFAKGFSQGLSFTSSHGEALGHVVKCIIPTQFQFFWQVKTNEAEILHIDIGRDVHFSPRTCI